MSAAAPGWNPDPTGRHEYRYWDGTVWTDDVSDGGVTSLDPLGDGPPADGQPTMAYDPTQQHVPQPGPYGAYDAQPGQPTGDLYGGGPVPPGVPPRSGPPTGLIVGTAAVAVAVVVALVVVLTSDDDDGTATDQTTETTSDTASDTTAEPTDDTTSDTTAEPTDDTGSEDTDVFTLAVGDCLVEDTQDGEVQSVPVVPCDQPHTSEIYLSHIIDADDLPDAAGMESIATDQCIGNFESFVGLPYEQSELVVTWLEPTRESWDAGDREMLCIVVDPAGNVTGTLEGAAR